MTIPNDLIGSNHKSSVMPQDLRAIHCKECPQKKMWYSQDLNMKALEDHCGSHHRGQTVETQFLLKCRLCRSQFTPTQSSKWSEHCKNDHHDSQKLSKVVQFTDICTVTFGFCDQPPSGGLRSINPARPLKQESGYSDQVVVKARVRV